MMTNPNALYEHMDKLNALYEELCWGYDDELIFTHDGEKISKDEVMGDYVEYE